MNNKRRSKLEFCNWDLKSVESQLQDVKECMLKLSNLKNNIDNLSKEITNISQKVKDIRAEEDYALVSMPDNLYLTDTVSNMEWALGSMDNALDQMTALFDKFDELETTYFSTFMSNYNPSAVIEKIDDLCEAIQDCREELIEAAR